MEADSAGNDTGGDIAEASAIGLAFDRGEFRKERELERSCPANAASAGEAGWKP
jgi:hypothetical protein